MTDVLFVDSSPRGADSESRRLAEAYLAGLRAAHAGALVDRLDAFAEDLPRFARAGADAKMTVIGGGAPEGPEARAWAGARALAERFRAARTLLLSVPMWNDGVPWALKQVIDTVSQPGVTFSFDPATGYHGLLGGRRAVALYTGAVWSPGAPEGFGVDFHSTYLEHWLGFVGVEEVASVRLQPTFDDGTLDARRATALAQARALGEAEGRRLREEAAGARGRAA